MQCVDCSADLGVDNPAWKIRCLRCYVAVRNAEKAAQGSGPGSAALATLEAQAVALRTELARHRQELKQLQTENVALRNELALLNKVNAGLNSQLIRAKPAALNSATVMKLIRLCHPDRHDNNALSNEVTAYLLDLRKGS